MAQRTYEFGVEDDNWGDYKKSSKKKNKPRETSESNRRLNPRDYDDYRYSNEEDYDYDY